MEYRTLGKTGLSVSVMGFGASPLGAEFGAVDPAEGRRAVDAALDVGINYFDVAPYYGRTLAETRLGDFLKGKRDGVILATKAGRYGKALPEGFDFSAARIKRSVEESLRRLRTDVIDVFQVHDVEFGAKSQLLHETLPAMQRLKEEGKVRFVGVTGYPLAYLKTLATEAEVDTVLSYCHYNLLNTRMEAVLVPFARSRRLGLVNASPLHMRALTDEGAPAWHPAPTFVHDAARKAAAWCRDHGYSLAGLALQFALQNEAVATTLVGMDRADHVVANARMVDAAPDAAVLARVRALLAPAIGVDWQVGLPENNDPGAVPGSGA